MYAPPALEPKVPPLALAFVGSSPRYANVAIIAARKTTMDAA